MSHSHDVGPRVGAPPQQLRRAVYDHHWARDLHASVGCSSGLLTLLLLIDWGTGSLTWWRGSFWLLLAVLLFLVLCPPRVSAGEGWLARRSLLRRRRVRTDRLVSVRAVDGVSQRLILQDDIGGRVEIDPRILTADPELWHRFDEDARASAAAGCRRCGAPALRRLSGQVDRDTALAVFRISGLES
jgi:hypothetical protein